MQQSWPMVPKKLRDKRAVVGEVGGFAPRCCEAGPPALLCRDVAPLLCSAAALFSPARGDSCQGWPRLHGDFKHALNISEPNIASRKGSFTRPGSGVREFQLSNTAQLGKLS